MSRCHKYNRCAGAWCCPRQHSERGTASANLGEYKMREVAISSCLRLQRDVAQWSTALAQHTR
eukprot:5300960-Amphidinium_carterae.1